jgi:hypothetical protein
MGRRACGSSANCALPVFGFSPRRLPGQAHLENFKRPKYSERVADACQIEKACSNEPFDAEL